MKIILENWKGFINEGTDYAEENAHFVLRNNVDNHRVICLPSLSRESLAH